MATADRILALKLIADTSGISKGVKETERATSRMGSSFKKLAGIAAGALAGLAVVDFAKGAIDAASAVGELDSKIKVLLGSSSKLVDTFAKGAEKLGLSEQSAKEAVGTFASLFRVVGLNRKQSARFSIQFTKLAADLASFADTTPEQAIEALGAALRGEAEPMLKYGVLMNDASLRAIALEEGITKTNRALTPQEKLLAARLLILRQTTTAQGDVARTADSLANTQRRLSAKLANIQLRVGQFILPSVTKIVGFITDKLVPAFESGNFGPVFAAVAGLGKEITDALFGKEVVDPGDAMTRPHWVRQGGLIEDAKKLGQQAVDALMGEFGKVGEKLGQVDWGKAIGDTINAAVGWVKDNINTITNLAILGGALATAMFVASLFVNAMKLVFAAPGFLAGGAVDLAVKAVGKSLGFAMRTAMFLTEAIITGFTSGLKILINRVGNAETVQTVAKGMGTKIGGIMQKGLLIGLAAGLLIELKKIVDDILDELGVPSNVDPVGGVNERARKRFEDRLKHKAGSGAFGDGGIVTGPTMALIGEKGPEAVVPLTGPHAGAFGGISIVVNTGVGDPVEIGRQVDRVLRAYRGRAGLPA